MEQMEEVSSVDESLDEIEEYFRESKKRLVSKVTVAVPCLVKIDDNETRLDNLKQDSLHHSREHKKSKRKHKKSKKSSKKKKKRSTSSDISCKNEIKTTTVSVEPPKIVTDKSELISLYERKTLSFRTSSSSLNEVKNEVVPKRPSLENRLEMFTFPLNQTKLSSENFVSQIKPLVNHFDNFNQNYNQFNKYDRFDQYNFVHQRFKNPNNLIIIEPKLDVLTSPQKSFTPCETQLNDTLNDLNDSKIIDQPIFEDKKYDLFDMSEKKVTETTMNECKEKPLEERTNKHTNVINNNEDDLEALKNKFRSQLEDRLFENNKKLLEEIKREKSKKEEMTTTTNSSFSNVDESLMDQDRSDKISKADQDVSRKQRKRDKRKKDDEKHKYSRHHKSSSHKRKDKHFKRKNSSKNDKKKYKSSDHDEDSDESMDYFDSVSNSVRRSDRIKVIETKKQYTKELEIAEKVKKLSYVNNENSQDSEMNELKENFVDSPINSESLSPVKPVSPTNKNESMTNLVSKAFSETANEIENFKWPSEYDQIDENIYLCKRNNNKNKESKKMVCDCTYSEQERQLGVLACGSDCLNRMLLIECGSRCPCGDFCTNRNFKTKNNAKLIPFKTENKGWGLKLGNDLKGQSFLIEYVGEVIDLKEFKKRCEKYSEQNNQHFYFMALQNDLFIDATKKGNISRFLNHSCDPNCETQKWTVNGELRIGFFTRRPVKANEELTFDYQFQTVGKKQQKCYCGSEKCRGYLGASSNSKSNQLNYIWDTDSEDDEESTSKSSIADSRSETESEVEEDKENKINKKIEKNKRHKKQKQNKDFDLNRQIKSIQSLSNKENVLKICQLMFRTENIDMRSDILDLLLSTQAEISLRLFMDYHGLKLLWSWMVDIDNKNDTLKHLDCKLKILEVLSMLSIKNRSVLEECKLLTIVKKWSEKEFPFNHDKFSSLNVNEDMDAQSLIELLINTLIDNAFEIAQNKNDNNYQELLDLFNQLKSKAKNLYDEWSNLKVAFKIPKKQQIEERKEHERELNDLEESNKNFTESNPSSSNINNNFQNFNRFKTFNRFNRTNPFYFKNRFNFNQTNSTTSSLTKEQRRKLFEQKVKEEEEKAAAAKAAEEEAQAKLQQQNPHELKWVYNTQINQWVQCLVPSNPPPVNPFVYQPSVQQYAYNPYQYPYGVPPPPPPLPPTISQSTPNTNDILTKINLTEKNLQNLQQAIQQFQDSSKATQEPNKKVILSASKHRSLAAIAAKLPPGWKCKRNNKGVIYYYNIKTKKTQWHFPKVLKTPSSIKKKLTLTSEPVITKSENEESKKEDTNDKISPTITSTTLDKHELDLSKSVNSESASASGSVSTSTNTFKELKNQFREKLSKFVIKLLEPFLKKDCKYGHIKHSDDFKHLARKFTHTIMEKEISRTTKLEELELDKRIKVKAQDYVFKYMQKFRDGYSRSIDTH